MSSGLLSVSFLSSSAFPVFHISYTAMAVVILRIENGNKKFTSGQQNQMTPNMNAGRLLFNTLQRCRAKLTAADSGGRASKRGNGVKKQRAGRSSLPVLMQKQTRPSGIELMSEPRTTRRAAERQATVAQGLEILVVLFESWLRKQLWCWLPGPRELPPAQL